MKTIYCHIGYPKCFSTTLQRDFFYKHSEIEYGGVGNIDNISYANNDIEWVFEVLLKYSSNTFWEQEKLNARKIVEKFIQGSKKKNIAFSSEYLGFKISPQEIDTIVKLKRIKYLFKSVPLKIIFIKREPIDFVRSIYKEYIRLGYAEEYIKFLTQLIIFKDRNFISDLNYKKRKKELNIIFGNENVFELSFLEIKKCPQENINLFFSKILNIKNENLPITFQNRTLKDFQYDLMLIHNKESKRGIGISILEPFEKHRNRSLYKLNDFEYNEPEVFSHVISKQKSIEYIVSQNQEKESQLFKNAAIHEQKLLEAIQYYS